VEKVIIKVISNWARANCLDASALVKLHVEELGSPELRAYVGSELCYTTPFCYFEALNVLKMKWLYRKEISKDEYNKAARSLTAWFSPVPHDVQDIDFTDPLIFRDVLSLSDRYSIDLSDAFQILSVKKGYFSSLTDKSSTILVTADEVLARAARNEGIRAWYFLTEPSP
jgi:predicted nucleic acid-binding protein